MLPASPLFLILAAFAISRFRVQGLRVALAASLVTIYAIQFGVMARQVRSTNLDELRTWVRENVQPHERFYVIGYSILRLPKNTRAMETYRAAYTREQEADRGALPFVERHIKNWEERAMLRLFDMLDFKNERGFEFYSYFELPPEKFPDLVALDRMDYLIVHDEMSSSPALRRFLDGYDRVATRRSEGGDGRGIVNHVYKRRVTAQPIGVSSE